jgi:hypothetical protein
MFDGVIDWIKWGGGLSQRGHGSLWTRHENAFQTQITTVNVTKYYVYRATLAPHTLGILALVKLHFFVFAPPFASRPLTAVVTPWIMPKSLRRTLYIRPNGLL